MDRSNGQSVKITRCGTVSNNYIILETKRTIFIILPIEFTLFVHSVKFIYYSLSLFIEYSNFHEGKKRLFEWRKKKRWNKVDQKPDETRSLDTLLLHDDLIENDDRSKTMLFSRLFKFHALHIGPTIVVHDGTMRLDASADERAPGLNAHARTIFLCHWNDRFSRSRSTRFRYIRNLINIPWRIHDRCFVSRWAKSRPRLTTLEFHEIVRTTIVPRSRVPAGPLNAFNSIVKFLKWSNCTGWVRRRNLEYVACTCRV